MTPNKSDKAKALDLALSHIEQQFGRGSLMRLGAAGTFAEVTVIPTGSLALDAALGVGGIPRDRITEIYGPEASGKTTLALHIIAEAQKAGGITAFVDAEHALDAVYASRLGVDVDALLVAQPDTGEQALDIVEMLVRSGALDVIVVDSVAALVPKAELEGEMGDASMGIQACLMSQALRKLTAVMSKAQTGVIFVNQLRQKIGVAFGNPEVTTGGNALKFYSSVRLDVRRTNVLKRGEEVVGNRTRVWVVKNKLAFSFCQVEFDVLYGQGMSRPGELLDLALQQGLIEKNGNWFSYNTMQIGQGREQAKAFLQTSSEVTAALELQVRKNLGLVIPTHFS